MQNIIKNQFYKIDKHRKDLQFLYFYICLDLTFTGSTFVTTLYPPLIDFLFPTQTINQAPFLYEIVANSLALIGLVTPFILTFFVLDKTLWLMIHAQRDQQKLMQKVVEWAFNRHYKKHRKDPKLPKWLNKILMILVGINTWLVSRKPWQQYTIILILFLINNPYILFLIFGSESL